MKSYYEYENDAGVHDLRIALNALKPDQVVWFAYKDGGCEQFDSVEEAKRYSKLVERKIIHSRERKEAHTALAIAEGKANEAFAADIRAELGEFTFNQQNIILRQAYEDTDYKDAYAQRAIELGMLINEVIRAV